jgi:hypothetical protein
VRPSAPSATLPSSSVLPTVKRRHAAEGSPRKRARGAPAAADLSAATAPAQAEVQARQGDPALPRMFFAEFFAGKGDLTRTMEARGIWCRPADDAATGGVDFNVKKDVDRVKEELRRLRTEGHSLAFHMAPACNSFSHARDRSSATKLRSSRHPEGLPDLDAGQQLLVTSANEMALSSFDLAVWLARDLSAAGTMEGPASSYMWAFLARMRPRFKIRWEDLKLSQCLFGTSWRKERRFGCREGENSKTHEK